MKGIHRHLSYANLMATIAVFIALGGGAYAFTLPKNSVKSKNIKDGAVHTADLGAGAVTTANLGAGAVTTGNLGPGAVTSDDLGEPAWVPRTPGWLVSSRAKGSSARIHSSVGI